MVFGAHLRKCSQLGPRGLFFNSREKLKIRWSTIWTSVLALGGGPPFAPISKPGQCPGSLWGEGYGGIKEEGEKVSIAPSMK